MTFLMDVLKCTDIRNLSNVLRGFLLTVNGDRFDDKFTCGTNFMKPKGDIPVKLSRNIVCDKLILSSFSLTCDRQGNKIHNASKHN